MSGGAQSGVVNSEKEVLRSFGEGLGTNDEHVRFVAVEMEFEFTSDLTSARQFVRAY